jgi:hypothetical protein
MSKDKPTIEYFSEVASGLAYIGDHIAALLKSIQRDEVEIMRLNNHVAELESQVEVLRDELESARKGDR